MIHETKNAWDVEIVTGILDLWIAPEIAAVKGFLVQTEMYQLHKIRSDVILGSSPALTESPSSQHEQENVSHSSSHVAKVGTI